MFYTNKSLLKLSRYDILTRLAIRSSRQNYSCMAFNFIIWDKSPNLFCLDGFVIRWYSLLFASGFVIGQLLLHYMCKKEGKSSAQVDLLTLHIILGTMIGARLGHVLFYDFAYYAQHPLESIFPIVFEPSFKFVGYQGLASHGAAIGIFAAIYFYVNYAVKISLWPPKCRLTRLAEVRESYIWVLDRILIFVALAGCLIRIGNFMNSEIIGKPTQKQYGVLFARDITQRIQQSSKAIAYAKVCKSDASKGVEALYPPIDLVIGFKSHYLEEESIHQFLVHNIKYLLTTDRYITKHLYESEGYPLQYHLSQDRKGAYVAHITTMGIPRHPAQLYEALTCLLLFGILFYRWWRVQGQLASGSNLGLFLVYIFGLRFLYEFLKENQVAFEDKLLLNMGQWLSVPLILVGIVFLFYGRKMFSK